MRSYVIVTVIIAVISVLVVTLQFAIAASTSSPYGSSVSHNHRDFRYPPAAPHFLDATASIAAPPRVIDDDATTTTQMYGKKKKMKQYFRARDLYLKEKHEIERMKQELEHMKQKLTSTKESVKLLSTELPLIDT